MEDFIKKVKELVKRLFEEGRPGDISREIRLLARRMNVGKIGLQEAKKVLNLYQAGSQADFIEKYTYDVAVKGVDEAIRGFESKIVEAVKRGIRQGDRQLAETLVKRVSDNSGRYVKTVVQTVSDGLNQGVNIQNATDAGIKFFKYVGPSSHARSFCVEHLNKIYSLDEIMAMSNGQGLPVMLYNGGYNCRHRWLAVIITMENVHLIANATLRESELKRLQSAA